MRSTPGTSRSPIPVRASATTNSTRLGAALLALFLAGGVTACSAGGGDASSTMDAKEGAADGIALDVRADESAPESASSALNRTVITTRAVIKTGVVATTGKDLDEIRQQIDQLLFGFGGELAGEETSHDDDGRIERSTLTLRVPVAKFDAAMDALEKLGRLKTSDSTSKDVTTEVIDVSERVETTQDSLDRLQGFLRRSQNIDDLIRFENEITTREAELQSLKAQQAYLSDQTSMATIKVYLSTAKTYVEPPGALDDAGFIAGLTSGWDALKVFAIATLTVVGAMIPWTVMIALLGVPTWLLLRASARRRAISTDAPTPTEPSAAS